MTHTESPAVARRRVRLALRRARERKGLTQTQVARALDWSLSKIQRIELGEVKVSTTDLRALLDHYEITDEATVARLMADSRATRQRPWFEEPKYRDHLTAATRQLLQFESEASAIRAFAPTLVPGLLQTPDYARAAFGDIPGALSPHEVAIRSEVRLRRRGQVTEREDPPDYLVILDESVLHRALGGAKVMAEQLSALLEIAATPPVRLRVVPFAAAATVALLGPFTVFDLGEDEDAVLYRERYADDEIVQDARDVHHHRTIFEDLWQRSLSEAASRRLIAARAATLLSSLDRKDTTG